MEVHSIPHLINQLMCEITLAIRWHKANIFFWYGSLFGLITASCDLILVVLFEIKLIEYFSFVVLIISIIALYGGMYSRRRIKHHDININKLHDELTTIGVMEAKNDKSKHR